MINNLVMEKCATVKEACTKVGRSKRLVVDNCGLNLNNLNLLFTDR
jgi:hypothetical protein